MKLRFSNAFVILVSLVLVAGIFIAGSLLYYSQKENCYTEAKRNLYAIADLKINELLAWRNERLGDASVFFENSVFSNLVEQSFAHPEDMSLRDELHAWLAHVRSGYQYDAIMLLDSDCNRWMAVPELDTRLSVRTVEKARESQHSHKIIFDDFSRNDQTGNIYLRIFVPICGKGGGATPIGALVMRIDPRSYLYPHIKWWPTPAMTGETALIRRDGNDAIFLNDLRFLDNSALNLRISLENRDDLAVRAVLDGDGLIEGVDYRGVPVFAAIRSVPNSPWYLVAKIDIAEVCAPLRQWLGLTILFMGALLFGVAEGMMFLWRYRHIAIYQQKYETEHKYRHLFENTRDALMFFEPPSWKFTACNPAMAEMFHFRSPQDMIGLAPMDLSPEYQLDGRESALVATEQIERTMQDGYCLLDWICKRSNGEEFPTSILLTKMSLGEHVFIQGTLRDISVQKKTEASLRTSLQILDGVLNTMPVRVFWKDRSLVFQGCNQAFAHDAGFADPKDIIGKDDYQLVWHDDAEKYQNDDRYIIETGDPRLFIEESQTSLTGEKLTLLTSKIPLRNSDGKITGVLGTYMDITERKQVEESLRQSKVRAEQYAAALQSANQSLKEFSRLAEDATRAKSEFLANMSHEIRTPLTAILGYADVMLEECEGRAVWEQVAIVKRNGEYLLGLINDILDLSKVEAGKLQIERVRCSPFQIVAEVISLMRVRATTKHLRLETDFVGPLPETILTDPLRLRQVLVNLVGNAIKFTDQGEVRITMRLEHESGGSQLCFAVSDTGIGMNDSQVRRLFQPFTQVDSSSTRRFGGTGLGLCLSKGIAEILGGRIQVQSESEKGSTFTLGIDPGPLDGIEMVENVHEAMLGYNPISAPSQLDKIVLHGRILLAEDGPDNQRLICLLLCKAGAEVTAVENGKLAVDAAWAAYESGNPFDLILMDMQMPVMDGYTATRELRKRKYAGPIIALTAHAMTEDAQKCSDAGCNDYATKPIDRQWFLNTVATWISLNKMPRRPATSSSENK